MRRFVERKIRMRENKVGNGRTKDGKTKINEKRKIRTRETKVK